MISWLNNARIHTKILICAALILVIVGVMTGVVYQGIVESQARDRLVLRANDIVSSSDSLLLQLTTMQLNYRSYLITGNASLLKPYDTSYLTYTNELALLQARVQDNPAELEQLRQLDSAVHIWRTYVHEPGIRMRKALGNSKTAAADTFTVLGYTDNQDFDHIRARLAVIRAAEAQNSQARQQDAQIAATNLQVMLLGGMLVASIFSLGTLSLLARNIARRVGRVTLAATQIANGAAGVRCELSPARDEVGLMAETFNTMAELIQQRTADLVAENAATALARQAAESAREQVADQLALINAQQAVIREMSVPVLPLLASTLVMPLVGGLDSQRLALMQTQALRALEQSHAKQLILDITGVPVVDTQVAFGLTQLVAAAKMVGGQVSIVGVRPEVAQALVGLGVNLAHIRTFSTLQIGIAQAFAAETSGPRLV